MVDALARSYVQGIVADPSLAVVAMYERRTLSAETRAWLDKMERRNVEAWVGVLRQARPELDEAEARVVVHGALSLGVAVCNYKSGLDDDSLVADRPPDGRGRAARRGHRAPGPAATGPQRHHRLTATGGLPRRDRVAHHGHRRLGDELGGAGPAGAVRLPKGERGDHPEHAVDDDADVGVAEVGPGAGEGVDPLLDVDAVGSAEGPLRRRRRGGAARARRRPRRPGRRARGSTMLRTRPSSTSQSVSPSRHHVGHTVHDAGRRPGARPRRGRRSCCRSGGTRPGPVMPAAAPMSSMPVAGVAPLREEPGRGLEDHLAAAAARSLPPLPPLVGGRALVEEGGDALAGVGRARRRRRARPSRARAASRGRWPASPAAGASSHRGRPWARRRACGRGRAPRRPARRPRRPRGWPAPRRRPRPR